MEPLILGFQLCTQWIQPPTGCELQTGGGTPGVVELSGSCHQEFSKPGHIEILQTLFGTIV